MYINDIIINDTLKLLKQRHPQMDYLNTYYMEAVITGPDTHHLIKQGNHQLRKHTLNTWYIPINHQHSHWLFLKVNFSTHQITQYDSLPQRESTRKYSQDIMPILNNILPGPWTGHHGVMQQQTNGYDCGVYVLAQIYQLVLGEEGPRGPPSRKHILAYLETNSRMTSFYTSQSSCPPPAQSPQQRENKLTSSTTTYPPSGSMSLLRPNQRTRPNLKPQLAQSNQHQQNSHNDIPKGDNLQEKEKNCIRLYSQNINGIPADTLEEHMHYMLQAMQDRDVDIIGWAETNLEWNNYRIHKKANRLFRKTYPRGKWITTTSKTTATTDYKPGGNAMGITQDISSRTPLWGQDPLGRWVWITMEGQSGSITVLQLYIPCPNSNPGIYTTYAQQYEQIQKANPTKTPNVLKTYFTDLNQFLYKKNTNTIIMGDFNSNLHNSDILDLLSNHNLRDAFDFKHPNQQFNTHQKGSQRIDYILMSAPLLSHIVNIGYEQINAGIPSDHRGMYLDLSREAITSVQNPPPRKLSAKHYTQTLQYRTRLRALYNHHNIHTRVRSMAKIHLSGVWKPRHNKILFRLDKDITNSMIKAEHTSRPNHTAPWHPPTHKLYNQIKQINNQISQLFPRRQERRHEELQVVPVFPVDMKQYQTLQNQRKKAIKQLREQRSQGYINRRSFLKERADIEELKGNGNRAQILKNISNVEDLRETYGHIKYVLNHETKNNLTTVKYPTAQGWKQTENSEELERNFLEQLSKHFTQASETPLAQDGAVYSIPHKTQPQHLLQLGLPDTTEGLQKFFLRHTKTPDIVGTITREDFTQGIKKWKEQTSTSPSGRHLGHYHAQILPPMNEEPENATAIFIYIHITLINIAIQQQLVLPRWQQVDTLCLPKDTGIPGIHRLRPLNLYEADLNLALRVILARRLTWNAEDHLLLPNDNWGSRHLHSSGDLGLQRVLTLELSTLTRTSLGQIDLDAKSCYDRILRPVAILACYKFGLPINLCCWLMLVLESQDHHILTTNGRSKRGYTSTPQTRLHGIGQGSCAAPVIWLLISSVLFLSMRQWAQGVTWRSPNRKTTTIRYADAFVDDSTIWVNNIANSHLLVKRMQHDLTKYQEMLSWTGGALTLEKCFFSVLEWQFTADGQPYLYDQTHILQIPRSPPERKRIRTLTTEIRTRGPNPLTIHLLEGIAGKKFPLNAPLAVQDTYLHACEQPVSIPQKKSRDNQVYLGLEMNPAGDAKAAETTFEQRNARFGIQIVGSRLQPPEVRLAHKAVHLPSQRYRFSGAPFSVKFLTKETNRLSTLILPKMNMARTHPLKLRYAPENRGGLGLPHFYVLQGTTNLKQIIQHIRLKTELGDTLMHHLQWTQMLTGLQTGILTDVSTPLEYVPRTWWIHVRQFLKTIEGNLHIEDSYTTPPLRGDDYSIMQHLVDSRRYGTTKLRRLNACRIFQQVTYMSEIAIAGDKLDREYLGANRHGKMSVSNQEWPTQTSPDKPTWKLWRKAILEVFVKDDGFTLRIPLKQNWSRILDHPRTWFYLYNPTSNTIYNPISHETFQQITASRRNHIFQKTTQIQDITNHRIPVQPTRKRDTLYVYKLHTTVERSSPPSRPHNPGPPHTILVSDGSVKNGVGTYGWVKATQNQEHSTGNGQVTGGPGTMTSYRSEAQGAAEVLHTSHPQEIQNSTLHIDNKGVVTRLNQLRPLHPLQAEWELLEPSRSRVKQCHIKVLHVKGHQDLGDPRTPRAAHLNHQADRLANAAHQEGETEGQVPPGFGVMLFIQGLPITSNYSVEIQRAATTPEIAEYYIRKHNWTDQIMDTIDWDAFGRAFGSFRTTQKRTLHKYIHNWLPLGKLLEHRHNQQSKCPHCSGQDTRDHLHACPHQTHSYHEHTTQLKQKLQTWKTEPGLARLLLQYIQNAPKQYTGTEKNEHWILQLQREQDQIGAHNLKIGFLTQTWGDIQESFHRREKHPIGDSGTLWATRVLTFIWDHALTMWNIRNTAIHNPKATATPQRKDQEHQVQILYNRYRDQPNILSGLFKYSLTTLLGKPSKYLLRWLRIAQHIPDHEAVEKHRRKKFGQDIRKYLSQAMKPPDGHPTSHTLQPNK